LAQAQAFFIFQAPAIKWLRATVVMIRVETSTIAIGADLGRKAGLIEKSMRGLAEKSMRVLADGTGEAQRSVAGKEVMAERRN